MLLYAYGMKWKTLMYSVMGPANMLLEHILIRKNLK